jgi:biopolymer transport protein ExbD
MKFPRNVRALKSPPDYAAVACVFFLLVMFIMLGPVTYTSGLRVQLPVSGELPGTDKPSVQLAVDSEGRLYFQNEEVSETELGQRLTRVVGETAEPLTLVIQADKSVTNDQLTRLAVITRKAGIHDGLLATLPRLVEPPAAPSPR